MLDGLESLGMRTHAVSTPERAWDQLAWCDLVLLAAAARGEMGLVQRFDERGKAVGLVLRAEDKGLAPHGLKAGARSVFVDEVQPEEVFRFVRVLNEEGLLRREVRWLRSEVRQLSVGGILIGESAPAGRLRRAIKGASPRYRIVLLRGEKGTNFGLVARAVHAQHPGQRHPILHWEPARHRPAALERALARLEEGKGEEGDLLRLGGSLLVEDAQALPPELQRRLAAAVGGKGVSRDFRLVLCQTHDPERLIQDPLLAELSEEGKSLIVRIPPLRDRRKDIPQLAGAILQEFAGRLGQENRTLTPGALESLASRPWWGNEAELEVALCRACLLAERSAISLDDLRLSPAERRPGEMEEFFRERLSSVVAALREGTQSDFYAHTIRSVEKPLFELVLRESGGNQLKAARLLGMNRNTLHRKLQELGLSRRAPARPSPRRR